VIWAKTDAGRTEIQAKALVKERAQRNLLLVIDGHKSEEMLLANLAGISADDFAALEAMGLIEPAGASPTRSGSARAGTTGVSSPAAAAGAGPASTDTPGQPVDVPTDYAHFTQTLTQLISRELGLRGFTLTLAVEKAGTIQELMDVATRAVAQIRSRKGDAAAEAARHALYGG
jgi:hypothetical protein